VKNEHLTRIEIIDDRLKQAGWDVTDRAQVVSEFSIIANTHMVQEAATHYGGKQFSDYVLLGKDGKPVAVVEAKKSSVDANIGKEQAKQYCYNIQKQYGGELPFCFFTNGHDIFFWDLGNYPPKKVYGFPTRDDLERYAYIRKKRKPLSGEFINAKIAGRDYQIGAIRAVLEAVEKRKRRFLLVMATGTGKTRTCIALVDALMRTGWVERVLFLVDRIALQEQTLDAFKEHLPNEPRWPKQGEKDIAKDRRIYVSTYPTMLNVIRHEEKTLSPHFFDLVVVDESHRSIYNTYQEVLNYFNTITLGLTATPKETEYASNITYFGVPVYTYSLKQGIQDGFLAPYKVIRIDIDKDVDGWTPPEGMTDDLGEEIEKRTYNQSDMDRVLILNQRTKLVAKRVMQLLNATNPYSKTIIFCEDIDHAERMRKAIVNAAGRIAVENPKYVMRITGDSVEGKAELDNFIDPESKFPVIATTSDLMTTGVDAKTCKLIVLDKTINSMTIFKQIIGRGTRIDEDNKKFFFTIMDFKKATELTTDLYIYSRSVNNKKLIDIKNLFL
jgi:type I restriction enzyme R subunit